MIEVRNRLGVVPGARRVRSALRGAVWDAALITRDAKSIRTELRSKRKQLQRARHDLRKTRDQLDAARSSAVALRARLAEYRDAKQNARRFSYAYRRLLAAARGTQSWMLPEELSSAPDNVWDKPYVDEVRKVAGEAAVLQLVRQGRPFDEAVALATRRQRWLDSADWRAVCQSLAANESTRVAGIVGWALVAQRLGQRELVWQLLSSVPTDDVARLAPAEYLRSALGDGSRDAVAVARGWIEDRRVSDPETLLQLTRLFFAADDPGTAQACLELAEAAKHLDEQTAASLAYLRPWVHRKITGPLPVSVPPGHVSFGVIDYKQPDEQTSSSNIGDYVQTIASLGHLLRHEGVRLHGEDSDLVEVVSFLQQRVRPDHMITGATAGSGVDVTLSLVQRDASHLDNIPDNTWMLAFGWYMHSQFDLSWDFPFNDKLNPIFISFHCNKSQLLTREVVDYLRVHGPIGCRDWTTVDLLLSAGVPAFFSGCLTTTIDTLFPEDFPRADAGAPVAYVDIAGPAPEGGVRVQQASPLVRATPAPQNIKEAIALLESYRSEYARVVTSRLHCYLPSWSIGVNVDFQPKNRADIRFAGLLDADRTDLIAMRQRIRQLLAPVLGRVLAGAGKDEVYALWREITEPEVAVARSVHAAPAVTPTNLFDIAATCRTIAGSKIVIEASQPREGRQIDIAVGLDGNLREQLATVIAGVVENTGRPVRIHALTRDHGSDDHDRLARLFPEVSFEWYACDDVDYGPVLRMLKHITVATMDRLLLPELLRHVDKVLYHDIDALAVADVGPLFDTDLTGVPLAGRPSTTYGYRHGMAALLASTRLLHGKPEAAREFVRAMAQRHDLWFRSFNAGIVVLNLALMRDEDFSSTFVPYVERYGLNDQEVLNAYAGSRYRVLDDRWNAWPTQEVVDDPWLIHWAGPVKPWDQQRYIAFKERWIEAERKVAARAAG